MILLDAQASEGVRRINDGVVGSTFYCDECGGIAATVYFLAPLARDPRLDPEPLGVPRGAGAIGQESSRISIAGGPVPVTISIAQNWAAEAIAALERHDVKRLRAIDAEFAPFWCSRCEKSYCRSHWRTAIKYDEGFFDCIEGTCPKGHRLTLMD
jgi:hypothetical protein